MRFMLTHLFRILNYGTSYAIATGFFPKEMAKKVLLLYSFVRIPDNIVDSPSLSGEGLGWGQHYVDSKTKLLALKDERTHAYTNNRREDSKRGQYIILFQDNTIPFEYSLDFYKAMIDDCTLHRYKTYEQLEWYMYGSASVVGLMMCHIIGFTDPKHEKKAKIYATELGNAMQLTNFLRDVREDYEQLGRIYIPSEILKKYGLSHNDIPRFINETQTTDIMDEIRKTSRTMTMKEMIAHCRTMYAHSLDGLQYLQPEGRKAVRLAALLYESILDKIEHNNYDVFTKSCRTTLRDKLKTLYRYKKNSWSDDIH